MEMANMGGLHNFKVEPIGENGICAKVYIDGKPVRCSGYSLEHFVDSVPNVQLEMFVSPKIEENVKIEVGNKKEIAELMDKTEFEEFCEIWKKVHSEKKECINIVCRYNNDEKCNSKETEKICPKRITKEIAKNLLVFDSRQKSE